MSMSRTWKLIAIAPFAILGILFVGFVAGEVVMRLWNWLLPPLFGWRQLTFWQAFGILALCRILFGGHGMGRSRSWQLKREDRERLRQAARQRFGVGATPGESQGF